MAQNVTLMGANYSSVPGVTLPKTGGGTAAFYDVTPTTASAADVATGKTFVAADGSITTGTNQGGGGGGSNPWDEMANGTWSVMGGSATSIPDYFMASAAFRTGRTTYRSYIASFPYATNIAGSAFMSASGLTSAYFPEVLSIAGGVFSTCTTLSYISFPKATYVGGMAFTSCIGLQYVDLPELASMGQSVFQGCNNLSYASLPKLTNVPYGTFSQANRLQSVFIPLATVISNYAFDRCGSLTAIDAPQAVSIGSNAFNYCTNLEIVKIGSARSNARIELYSSAFANCTKLSALYLYNRSTSIGTLPSNALNTTPFSNSTYLGYFGSIYVPASLMSTYMSASRWSLYSSRFAPIPDM